MRSNVRKPLKSSTDDEKSYEPKTPLGRKLWAIRSKIVASGEPLLGWDEIEREVAERRGEAN